MFRWMNKCYCSKEGKLTWQDGLEKSKNISGVKFVWHCFKKCWNKDRWVTIYKSLWFCFLFESFYKADSSGAKYTYLKHCLLLTEVRKELKKWNGFIFGHFWLMEGYLTCVLLPENKVSQPIPVLLHCKLIGANFVIRIVRIILVLK